MTVTPGIIVIFVTVVIFYTRMILLRQKKRKKALREISIQQAKNPRKGSKKSTPETKPQSPELGIEVANWYLVVAGVILTFVGFVLNDYKVTWLSLGDYWWVVTSLGVVLGGFGTK